MPSLSGIAANGSIMLFVGSGGPPMPTAENDGKDQPTDQKTQGYPQARGFLVVHKKFKPEMGVHVDELTQP